MLKWPMSALSKIGTIALVGYISMLGWENLGPRKPGIGPIRQELVDKIVSDMVEDIRSSRGDIRQATLLHFGNDPTDYFTDTLRDNIELSGVLDLGDLTFEEKARNVLNLRHHSFAETEAAVAEGRDRDVQTVLHGSIHSLGSRQSGTNADIEVHLLDVASGQPVFSKRYRMDASPLSSIAASIQETTQSFPWIQRFLAWVLTILLLPVFTITFIRTMVNKASNWTNVFVLGVYTLADALLAWMLTGSGLDSWFPVVVFIISVAAAFLYNVRVMTFAVRLEGE